MFSTTVKCSVEIVFNDFTETMTALTWTKDEEIDYYNGASCPYPEMYSNQNALNAGFAPAVVIPSLYPPQTKVVNCHLGYKASFFVAE